MGAAWVVALRRLPSFSGVAFLLGLLAALPWLTAASERVVPLPVSVPIIDYYTNANYGAQPPDWNLTLHLVSTPEEASELAMMLPNRSADWVIYLPPEDEYEFYQWRIGLNTSRQVNGLPLVRTNDLRSQP
jgi:hypothetical protein